MKKKPGILIIAAILLILSYAYAAQNYATIENMTFDRPQRPAAIFEHDEHNETAELEDDCSICHHSYEGKKLIEDESSEDSACADCHNLKPTVQNAVPLRMAFHNRCKTCHFESAKGPVLCGECHIKKERML
jgi:hypothetical protein